MRILLTRPEVDAKKTAGRLAALGHEAIICPLFEIAKTGAPRPKGPFDALLATSAHAFEHAQPRDPSDADRPLHVVGERTAQAARENGYGHIATIAPDAKALAISIARDGRGPRSFLYLAGRERRPELEASLGALGHRVTPWVLYETRERGNAPAALAAALQSQAIDAVMHFSPRSAALFVAAAESAGLRDGALAPIQIAISPRAAENLADAPDLRIAATPDLEGLIACLSDRA